MPKTLGLLGRKVGMSRIFGDDGMTVPVTVLAVGPCPVVQIKTVEKDGYNAIQIGYGDIPERKLTKPVKGHLAKALGADKHVRRLRELRLDDVSSYSAGQELTVEMFSPGEKVKVSGRSIGKGFQGVMKRHNFRGLRASHGTEKAHRSGGAIGHNTEPGKVMKGKKMAGQMGNKNVTTPNLTIVDVRPDLGVLLVKGAVPGAKNALIMVRKLA